MSSAPDPISTHLERDELDQAQDNYHARASRIEAMLSDYKRDNESLLGFVLQMTYDEATIVTCDAWKTKCGGVPRNSFVVIKLTAEASRFVGTEGVSRSLILGRIVDAVATPLSAEMQQTVFQIHKLQAVPDPYTDAELQWGALKVSILGTYYDAVTRSSNQPPPNGASDPDFAEASQTVQFGNDVDTYLSPHFYEVYVPSTEDFGRSSPKGSVLSSKVFCSRGRRGGRVP